jgi:hypothetical protein
MIQDNKVRLNSISANTIQPPDLRTPNLPPSQPPQQFYPKHPVHKRGKFTQNMYGIKWVKTIEMLVSRSILR